MSESLDRLGGNCCCRIPGDILEVTAAARAMIIKIVARSFASCGIRGDRFHVVTLGGNIPDPGRLNLKRAVGRECRRIGRITHFGAG